MSTKAYNSDGGQSFAGNGKAGGYGANKGSVTSSPSGGKSGRIANTGGKVGGGVNLGTFHGKHDVAHPLQGKSGSHTINHDGATV